MAGQEPEESAELERLRAIESRADEMANGEGWTWEEQKAARHILGESR